MYRKIYIRPRRSMYSEYMHRFIIANDLCTGILDHLSLLLVYCTTTEDITTARTRLLREDKLHLFS